MTCRDDGRVVFMVKGGAAKVNKPHRGVIYSPFIALLKGERAKKHPELCLIIKRVILLQFYGILIALCLS